MNIQDRIITVRQVAEIVGISVSTIRRLECKGKFPRKKQIPGSRRNGWSLLEINHYVQEVTNQSDSPILAHGRTWRTNKL